MPLRDCDFGLDPECLLDASISETGMLAPGVYALRASTHGSASSAFRYNANDSGSFELALELLPPAVPLLPQGGSALLGALLAGVALHVRRGLDPERARARR